MNAIESSKAFFKMLKEAGVAIPPHCFKVTIQAAIREPLLVRFECYTETNEAVASAGAVKELEADASINVMAVEFPRRIDVTKIESP